jgi:hypothetical protein
MLHCVENSYDHKSECENEIEQTHQQKSPSNDSIHRQQNFEKEIKDLFIKMMKGSDEFNKPNETKRTKKLNETNETNKINEINETNETNKSDKTNKLNELNESNGSNSSSDESNSGSIGSNFSSCSSNFKSSQLTPRIHRNDWSIRHPQDYDDLLKDVLNNNIDSNICTNDIGVNIEANNSTIKEEISERYLSSQNLSAINNHMNYTDTKNIKIVKNNKYEDQCCLIC